MTSKQALQDLFTISNKITKDKLNLDTKEIFERYKVIREDLEVLDILKRYVLTADLLDNDTKVFRINALFMWDDVGYKEIKRWMEENE